MKAKGAKVTGIFTSKAAERTAEIKAQQASKRPQVAGDTQVSPVPLYMFVCLSPAFCRVWFGFHREVLLS